MGVFDNELMSRTTGNLTLTGSGSAIKIRGTAVKGMSCRFIIPSSVGTTNQLMLRVETSDDDSTYRINAQYEGGVLSFASGTVGNEYIISFITDKRYAKAAFLVAGSTGTPNWGAVLAGFIENVGTDWSRATSWE